MSHLVILAFLSALATGHPQTTCVHGGPFLASTHGVMVGECDAGAGEKIPVQPNMGPGQNCTTNYLWVPPAGITSPDSDPNIYVCHFDIAVSVQNHNPKNTEMLCLDGQCWNIAPKSEGHISRPDHTHWMPSMSTLCDLPSPKGYGCGLQGTTILPSGFGMCANGPDLTLTSLIRIDECVP